MLVDRSAIGNAVVRGAFVLALCLSPIALPSAIKNRVDACSEGAVSRLYLGQATPAGTVTAPSRCRCSRREIADSGVHGIDGVVYPGTCRHPAIP